MKLCYIVGLLLMTGCATTTKTYKGVKDVNVGDVIAMTDKEFNDCSLTVQNIATVQGSPVGLIELKPAMVCGTLICTKPSIPEAVAPGIPICLKMTAFLPEVKKTK